MDYHYDTVFKVTMYGRPGVTAGVKATATSSASGHPAANLVNRSYLNYWYSNKTAPDPELQDPDEQRQQRVRHG